uniref:DUF1618 domain-containing protein n=1 Tax=Setaria italica TaxID=4555 RepID=K4A146_SETIT
MSTDRRLYPSTLHPPDLSADDDAGAEENLPWFLLELKAYVAKRDNATTAFSRTWDGKRIQVTLCPRRPPRVSYIHVEPRILAAEDDLAVLAITVGPQKDVDKNLDCYVYQVDDDGSGRPSLTHIPRPPRPYFFGANDTGVLRYRTDDEHTAGRREYIVAALYRAPWGLPAGQFDLCLSDSKRGYWKVHNVNFYHKNCKVVAIGGDAGTMAFVDLWWGIIFCDVLRVEGPLLRYVAVPEPMQNNKTLDDDARLYRDIAVVGDRLKYVELQLHWKACAHFSKSYFSDGWMASVGRPLDTEIMDSTDVKVHGKLVPKVWRDQGMALSPFRDLDACQPVLGLQEDADIVYFTTKLNRWDADAWVVAVDMRKRELLGVDAFAAQRYVGINFYVHARISKHLMNPETARD